MRQSPTSACMTTDFKLDFVRIFDGERSTIQPGILKNLNVWDLGVAALLVATLGFRLFTFEDARFAGDEAFMFAKAKSVAQFKEFPVTGVNMSGDNVWTPGGLYHIVMALPLLVSKTPQAAIVFTITLAIAGLALGHIIFRKEYGPFGSFIAISLAAFNPFGVFFSDRHWNPNILPALGFLWLFLLLRAMRNNSPRVWTGLAFLLAVAPQAHLSTTHLTLLTLAVVVITRPRVRWGRVALGVALGVVTYIPYFIADFRDGWVNTDKILHHMAEAAAPAGEALRATYYQVLYGGGDFTYFVGKGFWFPMTEWGFFFSEGRGYYAELLGLPSFSGVLMALVIATAVLFSLAGHVHMLAEKTVGLFRRGFESTREDPLATIAIINLPLILGTMLISHKAFYPHYTIVLFGLALVPIARLAGHLGRSVTLRTGFLAGVLIVVAVHGFLVFKYYRTEESKGSLYLQRETIRVIDEDSMGRSFQFSFAMPRTRLGSYSLRIMADKSLPFREDRNAKMHYILAPIDSPHGKSADAIWEIDGKWLIRKGP